MKRDGGHDPADRVLGPLRKQQGADNREGAQAYIEKGTLYAADQAHFFAQTGGAFEKVSYADARDVQGMIIHPPTRAKDRSVWEPSLPTPLPCSLALSVTTPLYSTTVSQTLRKALRGSKL
jgi:hypothetical protein